MNTDQQGVRLSKRVAAVQGCSRSQAEALIAAGAVRLDGVVVTDPARRVRDEVLHVAPGVVLHPGPLTVLLHKPAPIPAVDQLRQVWPTLALGPVPVRGLRECLALDGADTGLSVWTNDSSLERHLHDPVRALEQEWALTLQQALAPALVPAWRDMGLRISLGHEREGVGHWRVVGTARAMQMARRFEASQSPGAGLWHRVRIGRLGLSPLAADQGRLKTEFERF